MNNQKRCAFCGVANPRKARFCLKCGTQFRTTSKTGMLPFPSGTPQSVPSYYEPVERSQSLRRFKRRYVVYGIVGILVLFLFASAASPLTWNDAASETSSAHGSSLTHVATPTASAVTTKKAPIDQFPTVQIGTLRPQSAVVRGMEFSAKPVANTPQAFGTAGWNTPKAGTVFVAFDCTVKNVGRTSESANNRIEVSYWQLQDYKGNVHSAYWVIDDTLEPKLFKSADIRPGDAINGYVVFEVPIHHGVWKSVRYGDGSRDATIML